MRIREALSREQRDEIYLPHDVLGTTRFSGSECRKYRPAAKLANPLVQDEAYVAWGKKVYRNNCAYCHGEALVGLTAKDTGLAKDTPNLKRSLKIHSEGDIFWKIQSGRGDMPAFRQTLSEKDIWAVITYIKSEIR